VVCGECGAKNDDVELYCKKCGADLQIHFSGATPVLASGVGAGGGEVQEKEEEEPSVVATPAEEPSLVTTPAEIEVQKEETKESAQPVSPPYSPSEVEAGPAETTQEAREKKPDTQPEKSAWERFSQEEKEEKPAKEYVLSETPMELILLGDTFDFLTVSYDWTETNKKGQKIKRGFRVSSLGLS